MKSKKLIRECIVIGGKASGGNILGKTRDRNYRPRLEMLRTLTKDGLEIVVLHDRDTNYMEGMNSNGIGIVNAALLVAADEKAAGKYWGRTKKKKGSSNDGPRIVKALSYPKLSQAIKSIVGYDTGLKGHTLVGNPKSLYSVEMTSKHNPIVNKLDPTTGFDIRTNHGEDHEGAGYSPITHADDYLSSKIRKASASTVLASIEDPEQLMPALASQNFEPDSNYNMLRKTGNMRSSSQTLMNLDNLEFLCYLIPGECTFNGIKDMTPDDYEPMINIRVIEYEDEK